MLHHGDQTHMKTITVATQSELLAALKTAQGGDIVLLADGNYGDIELKNDYASTVTIKAVNHGGAEFGNLALVGATNITLDGLQFTKGLGAKDFSSGIAIVNSEITGTLYMREVDDLKVDNVEVSGGQFGVIFNSVRNFSLTNSHIHDSVEDLVRITTNSYNGLIENNVIANTTGGRPLHPDIIQFFGNNGKTPHDITIRGNLLYDDTKVGETNAQGIFLSDPRTMGGYKNILIEDNLIRTNSPNTIYIDGGQENVVVRNNTLMPGLGDGGAFIRLATKSGFDNSGTTIEGNVAKLLLDETKSSDISDNHFYGRNADLAKLFSGTDYTSWESYVPKEGSVIDFGTDLGAQLRLLSLLKEATSMVRPDVGMPPPLPQPLPETLSESLPAPKPSPVLEAVLPGLGQQNALYVQGTVAELRGWGNDFVKVDHTKAMAIDTGSISLTFNADQTTWVRGILSKDAKGLGDSVSAWIDKGRLIVRFEDGEKTITFTQPGIEANRDYKLLLTFDEEKVKVWLDDTLVGEATADVDLSHNSNDIVIGAFNGRSSAGTTDGVRDFFDGTISDVMIHGKVLTPAELAAGGISAAKVAPPALSPVYAQNEGVNLRGWGNDFVKVDHTKAMAIDTGSISLTFNADQTTWVRGILSKDAKGLGDSVSAWIDKGRLIVRFEDGEKTITFTQPGIEANRDYKLLLTFDEEKVKVWLDDTLVGEATADVDLSHNSNDIVIGAFNGRSSAGTTDGVRDFFDGTISDVMIHGKVLTPAELAALDSDVHLNSLSGFHTAAFSSGGILS